MVLNTIIGRMQTEKYKTGSAQAELYPSAIDKFIVPFLESNKIYEELKQKIPDEEKKSYYEKSVNIFKTTQEIIVGYEKIKERLKNYLKTYKDLPETVYFGFFGILCLIGWDLIYPLCIIPKSNLDSLYTYFFIPSLCIKTTILLKGTFIFGIIILLLYLISEYIYIKYPIYYFKTMDKIKRKPKTEENTKK